MTENEIKQIQLKWSMMSDEMRWRLVPELQLTHPRIIVGLDNDDTFIIHRDIAGEIFLLQFDEYVGWSDGAQSLLKAFNIKAEPV